MKVPRSDEKVEKETSDGLYLYLVAWSHSLPDRLRAWRSALLKPEVMENLRKIAELCREKKLLEQKLGEKLYKIAEEVAELVGMNEPEGNAAKLMEMADSEGQHWYEVPVDGKNGTAHEALARFCEIAYKRNPAKR